MFLLLLGVENVKMINVDPNDTEYPIELRGHYVGIYRVSHPNKTYPYICTEIAVNCEGAGNTPKPIVFARSSYSALTPSQPVWSDWVRVDNFGCSTPADLASLLGEKYVTTVKQDIVNGRYKITRIKGGAALVTIEMGGTTQAVYLIGFNDNNDSTFTQSVKLLFKRGTNTINWGEDTQGNLYFTSQYGNSRGHSVIGLTGQVFTVTADSTSSVTGVTVIDTTYLDSYSTLAQLKAALDAV